ncbi:MAG: hypothetical protein RL459_419 [Pseudomonadota bacterium]|jgi:hypothetical protein
MSLADIESPGPAASLDLTNTNSAALRRGRLARRALFATLGLLAGVWGAHILPLIGAIANNASLTAALSVVVVASEALAWGARRVA